METSIMPGIRARRLALGLSQRQVAERLFVERGTVAMWETGRSYPSGTLLPQLAEALQCSITALYVPAPDTKG